MSRFSSLFAPIRQSLLERDDNPFESFDPFGPLDDERRKRRPVSLPLTAPVGPPNLPKTRNRADDVGRVEGALGRAGILGGKRQRPVFDTSLETGVRDFQRQKGLRVDGLLNPGGPTIKALGRAVARPPLKGLSGAAVSANARLVRHLMTTTADGMVPGLMAADFGLGEAGRAKTADFLSQLFGRDPARARSLRVKARGLMETDEKSLLDKLILQARLFEEDDPDDDDGDEQPPEEEPPQEPEEEPTPDDPGQDDPEDPDEPDEPEKPKPDCEAEEEAVESAKEEVDNAESHLEAAESAVADMELNISLTERKISKTEGEIQEGKKIIPLRERELEIAEYDARHNWNKVAREMARQKAISLRKNLKLLKEDFELAQEELKAFRAELKTFKESLSERKKAVADAEESLEQAQAALDEAEKALASCENRGG